MANAFVTSTGAGTLRGTHYNPTGAGGSRTYSLFSSTPARLPEGSSGLRSLDFVAAAKWVWERPWAEENKLLRALIVSNLIGEDPETLRANQFQTANAVDQLLARHTPPPSHNLLFDPARHSRARAAVEHLLSAKEKCLISDTHTRLTVDDWLFLNKLEPSIKAKDSPTSLVRALLTRLNSEALHRWAQVTKETSAIKTRQLVHGFLSTGEEPHILNLLASAAMRSRPRRGLIMSDLPPTLLKFSHGVFGFTALQIFANQISKPEILKPLDYLAPFFLAQGVVMSTLPTATGIIGGGIGNEIGSNIAHRLNLSRKQTRNVEIVSSTIGGLIGTAAPFALLGEKAVSAASIVNLVARCVAPQVEAVIFIGGICVAGYLLYQDASQHTH